MKASGSHPERVSYKVGQIEKIKFSEVKEKEIKITSRKLDFEDVENKRGCISKTILPIYLYTYVSTIIFEGLSENQRK